MGAEMNIEQIKQHVTGAALVISAFSAVSFVFVALCHIAGVQ